MASDCRREKIFLDFIKISIDILENGGSNNSRKTGEYEE